MRDIAQLFQIDLNRAIGLLWKEHVGDPCSCCGNSKVLPDNDKAQHLYVKIVCEKCGDERLEPKQSKHQRKVCGRCYRARGQWVKLRCVGYQPFSAVLFAKRCPREGKFLPRRLKNWRRKSDDGQHVFVDVEQGIYRCRWCAGAFQMIRQREMDLKKRWAEATRGRLGIPDKFPKIQNLTNLDAVQSKLYGDEAFRENQFAKKKPGAKQKTGPKPGHSRHPSVGLARWWRRPGKLPGIVHGLCGICDGLLLRYISPSQKRWRIKRGHWPLRFHKPCLAEYQREHGTRGGPEERRRRGAQIEIKSLKRHFAWAIRHEVLNESLGKIAADFGVQKTTVVDGIAFIKCHLPEERVLAPRFNRIISLLRKPI
jgi:hypothetical protein